MEDTHLVLRCASQFVYQEFELESFLDGGNVGSEFFDYALYDIPLASGNRIHLGIFFYVFRGRVVLFLNPSNRFYISGSKFESLVSHRQWRYYLVEYLRGESEFREKPVRPVFREFASSRIGEVQCQLQYGVGIRIE